MSRRRQHIRNVRAACEAGTPLDGEYVYDQTLKTIRAGDGETIGGNLLKRWRHSYPVSPAQLAADQNDFNPTDLALAETLFLSADAVRNITGLLAGGAGARLTIVNRGAFDIVLKNASAGSVAANRFLFETDVVLRPAGAIDLQYSAQDSRWMRADGGTKFSRVPQEILFTGVITPAQLTADQDNYAPTDGVDAGKVLALAAVVRASSDASRNITGLVDPRDGVIKTILNAGTNPIVLKNAAAGSAPANRFDFGADVTLGAKQSATIRYDGADQCWKLEAATAGASVAAGAVISQTLAASALNARCGMINGIIVESHAGNAVTFAIKTFAGADPTVGDPVLAVFQDGAGGYVMRSITAALSLTISSGSSMGVGANTAFRLWHVLVDTGAGVVLGAVNCFNGATNIMALRDDVTYSTTAEGGAGAADNARVIYTAAAQTGKFICIAGYSDYGDRGGGNYGLAAAGLWASSPTKTVLFGSGTPRPGEPTGNVAKTFVNNVATGTTIIPGDDTVPQNNEGDQYISTTLNSSSPCNVARYSSYLTASLSAIGGIFCAIFQDSIASALSSGWASVGGAGSAINISINSSILIGVNGSTTFKLRAGPAGSSTLTVNGSGGSRLLGGSIPTSLGIEEIMG